MLNHYSWASYFEVVALLLVIYYIIIGIRYYSIDIREFINQRQKQESPSIPEKTAYVEQGALQAEIIETSPYVQDNYPDDDLRETDELIAEAKSLIDAAAAKAYGPESLISRLRELFRQYPSLKTSPHRPAINELVVSECEKNGVAELSEDEVDAWWSD